MRTLVLISALIIILNSCSNTESEFERKSKTFDSIETKYKDIGFSGISDIDIKYKQIEIYSRILLEKQNIFDSISVKNLTDSFRTKFLSRHNLLKTDFEKDIDSVNSYSSTYLNQLYEMIGDEKSFKSRVHDAFKANGSLKFDDLLFYFDNLYFKLSPDSKYHYVNSVTNSEIEKWMTGSKGLILEFEYAVKKNMRDPDSFEHIETSYNNKGVDARVKMKYRGKNKLGIIVLTEANGILDTENGTVTITSIN